MGSITFSPLTVQGMKEAETCEEIKNGLLQRRYTIPLVADIHLFPPATMCVIDFVDLYVGKRGRSLSRSH